MKKAPPASSRGSTTKASHSHYSIIPDKITMAENEVDVNEELLDYEDEPEAEIGGDGEVAAGKVNFFFVIHLNDLHSIETAQAQNGKVKGNYVSIHSSGFRDFLLKPEVLRSIVECGFEHPSEVQHECIPQVDIEQKPQNYSA